MSPKKDWIIPREEIKAKVIAKLQAVSDHRPIDDPDKLRDDLGMTAPLIEGMATPYDKIAQQYPGAKRVRLSDTRGNKTVKDAVDIVHMRANGE